MNKERNIFSFCLTEKEELIKRHYPYPFDTTYFNHIEYDDYSHSEKELCLGVTFNLKEEQNER